MRFSQGPPTCISVVGLHQNLQLQLKSTGKCQDLAHEMLRTLYLRNRGSDPLSIDKDLGFRFTVYTHTHTSLSLSSIYKADSKKCKTKTHLQPETMRASVGASTHSNPILPVCTSWALVYTLTVAINNTESAPIPTTVPTHTTRIPFVKSAKKV